MIMATKITRGKKLHVEVIRQMLTLATSGFGFVAALAWNNLIQDLMNNYIRKWFPQGSSISLLIYALVVTTLAVIITLQLSNILQNLESNKQHERN